MVFAAAIPNDVADEFGYTYTEEHGGHYIGLNEHWNENEEFIMTKMI